MLNLSPEIDTLSNFKDRTPEFIRQLKETGRPVVLTIDGKAEIIVQDSVSYQKMIERAERAEQLEITRRSAAEMNAGLGRPAEEMLEDMRTMLEQEPSR